MASVSRTKQFLRTDGNVVQQARASINVELLYVCTLTGAAMEARGGIGPLLEIARKLTLITNSGGHVAGGRKPECLSRPLVQLDATAERDMGTSERRQWQLKDKFLLNCRHSQKGITSLPIAKNGPDHSMVWATSNRYFGLRYVSSCGLCGR